MDVIVLYSNVGLRILNIVKLIPRIFNEFKLKKESKKRSYAKQLMQNGEIMKLQQRITDGTYSVLKSVAGEGDFLT